MKRNIYLLTLAVLVLIEVGFYLMVDLSKNALGYCAAAAIIIAIIFVYNGNRIIHYREVSTLRGLILTLVCCVAAVMIACQYTAAAFGYTQFWVWSISVAVGISAMIPAIISIGLWFAPAPHR